MLKSNISEVFYHKYKKIKANLHDYLRLEKILLKPVFNKNRNRCYCDMFQKNANVNNIKNLPNNRTDVS